jgi:hypothetical protein|tara:strand:+ start:4012 stop:4407 length:396 start_codon:yes stop_codon:yes gene_type:complete
MENSNKNKKFPSSLKVLASNKILFRLINIKRENTRSYDIFEESKFSTTIKDLFTLTNYRKVDYSYDTKENNRFSTIRLIVENKNDTKENKDELISIIEENKKYLNDKENNIRNRKAIEENILFFEEKISNL